MLGYYTCEFVGSLTNFICSLFGVYPAIELGVRWLLVFESRRVIKQTQKSNAFRKEKESEAQQLELRAKESDG